MVGLRPIIEFMTFSFSLGRFRSGREQRAEHVHDVRAASSISRLHSAARMDPRTNLAPPIRTRRNLCMPTRPA